MASNWLVVGFTYITCYGTYTIEIQGKRDWPNHFKLWFLIYLQSLFMIMTLLVHWYCNIPISIGRLLVKQLVCLLHCQKVAGSYLTPPALLCEIYYSEIYFNIIYYHSPTFSSFMGIIMLFFPFRTLLITPCRARCMRNPFILPHLWPYWQVNLVSYHI